MREIKLQKEKKKKKKRDCKFRERQSSSLTFTIIHLFNRANIKSDRENIDRNI